MVAIACALWTSSALAEPTHAPGAPMLADSADLRRAEQLFETGRAAYERGEYSAATAAFRASYELSLAPALLLNVAQALRLSGRCKEALDYYARYRVSASQALPSDFDEIVRQAELCASRDESAVSNLAPSAQHQSASSPAAVAEPSVATAPNSPLAPSTAQAKKPAAKRQTKLFIPSPKVQDSGDTGSGQRTTAIVLGGVGLASLGVAGYFGVRTLLLVRDADCTSQNVCSARGVRTIREAGRAQTAGFVAAGIGAAALGGGVLLWLTAPSTPASGHSTSALLVGITPTQAWLATTW